MSIGDTVNVTFDCVLPHGKRAPTHEHYEGPATVVGIDEWPLDAEPIYRVHPTDGWKRGDVFVCEQEVVS